MPLTTKFKQELKGRAHSKKPIVFISHNGFSESVKKEIDRALNDHELIKIRIQVEDRDLRKELAAEVCSTLRAEFIQMVGNICILYRKNL